MEYSPKSHGQRTLLENTWPVLMPVAAAGVMQLLPVLTGSPATRWLAAFITACALSSAGVVLLLVAKLPLYRQRRFLTFGSGALPENRRALYRRGWWCLAAGSAILIALKCLGA